ncbi:hypothetical protein T265_06159 [Opisthorchis viverrini]|uniref:Uncharacterized protein n=1 Tax=Opisthorchis viverrini TaxID=6198 RepID=A0A074ZLP0_OPIVI|nr:hypothetical protein T265_06159 [Opisthorchis viverrini]KER26657.1 hypothetical protein T265_06159 [Opisthorchis viverrini]
MTAGLQQIVHHITTTAVMVNADHSFVTLFRLACKRREADLRETCPIIGIHRYTVSEGKIAAKLQRMRPEITLDTAATRLTLLTFSQVVHVPFSKTEIAVDMPLSAEVSCLHQSHEKQLVELTYLSIVVMPALRMLHFGGFGVERKSASEDAILRSWLSGLARRRLSVNNWVVWRVLCVRKELATDKAIFAEAADVSGGFTIRDSHEKQLVELTYLSIVVMPALRMLHFGGFGVERKSASEDAILRSWLSGLARRRLSVNNWVVWRVLCVRKELATDKAIFAEAADVSGGFTIRDVGIILYFKRLTLKTL